MSKAIKLAPELTFSPEEFACEVTAAIGNRGGGKSNGCAVAVEQLLDAGVQVVVIDYVGIWFSLRLMPDGKTPSRHAIPVLGGRHGDVDLSPAAGAVVAEALAERRSSAILDVSLFSKGDRARFATDFAEAFFRSKKQHRSPCLIVLEEAQRYVPQRVFKGQERMLGAFEEIAEVGRNFGIGLFLISQRPQKINKDVLNLADNLLAFRTIGKHERVALEEWVQEKGAAGQRDIGDVLPGLPTGTCYAWSPIRGVFGTYKITLKGTYDAGATPLAVASKVSTKPLDLAALEKAMGKAAEAVQVGTPAALSAECGRLRQKVATLERQLAEKIESQTLALQSEQPFFDFGELIEMLYKSRLEISNVVTHVATCDKIVADMASRKVAASRAGRRPTVELSLPKVKKGSNIDGKLSRGLAFERVTQLKKEFPRPKPIDVSKQTAKIMQTLATGEHRVLVAAAQHASQGGVTREQLTVLCGYKRSSRDTFIQRLRAAELLKVEGDKVAPTERGMEYLGSDFEALPSGKALLEYWRQRLSEGERRVLDAAVSVYPDGVSRDQLDAETGYKRSSRDTFIQRLRSRQLCTTTGGEVRASDMLFDFPERM